MLVICKPLFSKSNGKPIDSLTGKWHEIPIFKVRVAAIWRMLYWSPILEDVWKQGDQKDVVHG